MIYTQAEMEQWNSNVTHPERLPPVIVTRDGYIIDGYHRVQRAKMLDILIAAIVLDVEVTMLDPHTLKVFTQEVGE